VAQARLSVRKIREVLRLKAEARLSDRQIAAVIGSARSTVQECLRRTRAAGVTRPLPPECDEEELHARLYPRAAAPPRYPTPDFAAIHAELARKGVTRMLLWQEYKARHPDGCQYSAFCRDYEAWLGRQDAVMRFEHTPSDKLFVDYAGQTMAVVDRHSGEVQVAQIFVAALGASHYTYVEATLTQTVTDWLGAHVRALEYFGGSPRAIVPDNLKSGVHRACRYEPDLNPSYQDFAEHYGVAILPARVRKPRDKAKVAVAVQGIERWILAPLRHATFFSLAVPSSTPRCGPSLRPTTTGPCHGRRARGAAASPSSSGRRSGRCRPGATSWPPGRRQDERGGRKALAVERAAYGARGTAPCYPQNKRAGKCCSLVHHHVFGGVAELRRILDRVARGPSVRYLLARERLSRALLLCLPPIDVLLLVFTAIDLRRGSTATFAHGLAAAYVGFTVAFGGRAVMWADAHFAHRFAAGPAPAKAPSRGWEAVRYDSNLWGRCIVACIITMALVEALVQLVGSDEATQPLLAWHKHAFGCIVLWFFFGPAWSLATAWRRSH